MTKKNENKKKEKTLIIDLSIPQDFEGEHITQIDLSSLNELSADDLAYCEGLFQQMGNVDPTKEFNMRYCMIVAHRATGKPLEFFNGLKAKNAIKIKTVISNFLYD